MSTQKRRVIWMDDESWDMLGRVVDIEQKRAKVGGTWQKITPSLVIRDCLDRGHFRVLREREEPIIAEGSLGAIAAVQGFNSRPFTPVPKGGKK